MDLLNAGKRDNAAGFDFALRQEALKMVRHKAGIIIDPNSAARASLRAMLSAIGMTQVAQATGAADAIRRVKERPTDVILCDYLLDDGRDGQQLLEEMRGKHLIPLSTAFIVITRERRYQSVVSVAELAPDDYLLKPFTPQHLLERLQAVLEKKHAFRHAHRHVEASEVAAALTACDDICAKHPPYRLDALRLKAETLVAAGRAREAEELYRIILSHKAVPWAKMGLALTSHDSGTLDEAAELVIDVVQHHPHYLAAYDLAAKIEEKRGRLAEAQSHLQAATVHSPHALARQRELGRVAVENGDMAVAETAMTTVISRGAGSSLREAADFAQLARLQIATGREAAALETVATLNRELRGDPDAAIVGPALAAVAHGKLGNAEAAKAAAGEALKRAEQLGHDLPPGLLVDVSQALYVVGDASGGEAILRRAIARGEDDERFSKYMNQVLGSLKETAGLAENLRDDVKKRFIEINNEGVKLGQAGHLDEAIEHFREAAAQLPSSLMYSNAAKAILAKLSRDGWSESLASEARDYLKRGRRQSPGDARIQAAIGMYAQVANRYGIREQESAWE
jgi:DNA-binding response OmpR family regulator